MLKDLLKLTALLMIVAAMIVGIYLLGQTVDNQSKYRHPITRPGASW